MGSSTIDDGSHQGGGRRRWRAGDGMTAIGVVLGILLLVGLLVRFWVLILAVVIIAIAVWLIHDSRVQRQEPISDHAPTPNIRPSCVASAAGCTGSTNRRRYEGSTRWSGVRLTAARRR
nr:hypothetical protein [uncultured Rhodococcus sp.]